MTAPVTDHLAEHLRTAIGLLVLAGLTVALARRTGIGLGWTPLTALALATLQLGIVAVLLRFVLETPWLVVGFVALMLATASRASGRRLDGLWHRRRVAAAGVVAGSAVALSVVLALGLVRPEPRYAVATAGIVVGSAMTAATHAGRGFLREAGLRRDELEGLLALGATQSQAHAELGRSAAREAVLLNLDQTRATGLVTLPGAFVGALFGGASPVEAAQFQLVVLAAIALAMTTTALVVTRLAGRTPYLLERAEG